VDSHESTKPDETTAILSVPFRFVSFVTSWLQCRLRGTRAADDGRCIGPRPFNLDFDLILTLNFNLDLNLVLNLNLDLDLNLNLGLSQPSRLTWTEWATMLTLFRYE